MQEIKHNFIIIFNLKEFYIILVAVHYSYSMFNFISRSRYSLNTSHRSFYDTFYNTLPRIYDIFRHNYKYFLVTSNFIRYFFNDF